MQSAVARIKAADADIGSNAEMDYRIMDGDGPGMFNITTEESTQDGVIILLKVPHIKPGLGEHQTQPLLLEPCARDTELFPATFSNRWRERVELNIVWSIDGLFHIQYTVGFFLFSR